ncbi:hypothetical protein JCM17380_02260 [Desulfosporosinus burensis]
MILASVIRKTGPVIGYLGLTENYSFVKKLFSKAKIMISS